MTQYLDAQHLIACIIVSLAGFTIILSCGIVTLIALFNRERSQWREERMELQTRIQSGTAEMFIRTKMNVAQLDEARKQADHERELEKEGKKAIPEEGEQY